MLYPIYLDLEDRACLVVGGGRVALRKVKGLLEAGARIRVVAKNALPELRDLAAGGKIVLVERPFEAADAGDEWLVFCATDDESVNRSVFEAAEAAHIPANVADVPHLCRFHVPSRYKGGRLQAALSTGGGSPALARKLRESLEDFLGSWAPRLVEWMACWRDRIKAEAAGDTVWRGRFLNRLADDHFELLREFAADDDRPGFDAFVERALEDAKS